MTYSPPELTLVGDARGIVLSVNFLICTVDTDRGKPFTPGHPYTTWGCSV